MVLVSEALGFEVGLLQLDALAHEELALASFASHPAVCSVPANLEAPALHCKAVAVACTHTHTDHKKCNKLMFFENPLKRNEFECNNKILHETTRYCIATAKYCMQQQSIACVRLIRQDRREVHAMACDLENQSLLLASPVARHRGSTRGRLCNS